MRLMAGLSPEISHDRIPEKFISLTGIYATHLEDQVSGLYKYDPVAASSLNLAVK